MKRRGITLIDALVAIYIIAIIALIATPSWMKAKTKKQVFPLKTDTLLFTQTTASGIEIEYSVARDVAEYGKYDDPNTPDTVEIAVLVVATVKSHFAVFSDHPKLGALLEHPSTVILPQDAELFSFPITVPIEVMDDDIVFITTVSETDD